MSRKKQPTPIADVWKVDPSSVVLFYVPAKKGATPVRSPQPAAAGAAA
jgi:hypothetical protein